MTSPPDEATARRPFALLGLQQLAIGHVDRSRLHRLWVDLLGLVPSGSFRSERDNVVEDICRLGRGAMALEIDLMQPIDAAARPAVQSPALNHAGFWVDDLAAAHAWLSARGVRFAEGGIRTGAAGHDVCFIHPKPSADAPLSGEGVLIELVQAPPEIVASLRRDPASADIAWSAVDLQFTELVVPALANHYGTLFAPQALALLGKAAYLAAARHARQAVVMASSRQIEFARPVPVGSLLSVHARVVRVGRSSMTVQVGARIDAPAIDPADDVLRGEFELVAVDAQGRPSRIGAPAGASAAGHTAGPADSRPNTEATT